MNEQKTIKDYTVEELTTTLTAVMARILGTQEQLQALANQRQVIEQELKGREKEEPKTDKAQETLDKSIKEGLKKTK